MSHPIPEDAQRLAARLRMAADEIESAARYGVPIPFCVTVGGHEFASMSFSATEHEFAAWAEYAEAAVEQYEHDGYDWSAATADINGLPVRFSVRHEAEAVTA